MELKDIVALFMPFQTRKEGKKEDAPLNLILKFEANIEAREILPYFHPTLSHAIFDDNGVRFGSALKCFNWDESHNNMEIDLSALNITMQATKIHKYKLWPYAKVNETEPDFRNCVRVSFEAIVKIGAGEIFPLALLAEMINTELMINIRPSQLLIPEMASPSAKAPEDNAKAVKKDKAEPRLKVMDSGKGKLN